MKKILALLLALSMLVLLSACGDKAASNDENSDGGNNTSTVREYLTGGSMNMGYFDGHAATVTKEAWLLNGYYQRDLMRKGFKNDYSL